MKTINVLSLGAGVQSSALLFMANEGKFHIDFAIFSDTHSETKETYDYLEYLKSKSQIPIVIVEQGNIEQDIIDSCKEKKRLDNPAFHIKIKNKKSILSQRCTGHYKIKAIRKYLQNYRKENAIDKIIMYLGISYDEIHRMKRSDVQYVENKYYLIENKITRTMLYKYFEDNGYEKAKKSRCIVCPFNSLKRINSFTNDEKQRLIEIDSTLRSGWKGIRSDAEVYLTGQQLPISFILKNIEKYKDDSNIENGFCNSGVCFV